MIEYKGGEEMRKGVLLTQRDLKLLKFLSMGPISRGGIFKTIFAMEGANTRTRERVMVRRLAKLRAGNLILNATLPNMKDTVYMLTKPGASLVASHYGKELSNILVTFNQKTIEHDMFVAGCARKIHIEAEEEERYTLYYLKLECA
jgi:hypothetical protein